jgi:hypothetical protein
MAAGWRAGGIDDSTVTPRPSKVIPGSASGGAWVEPEVPSPLTSSEPRIPADGRGSNRSRGSKATPGGDLADPGDANDHIETPYRAIGVPMNQDQEDLPGDGPVAIGEILNADDPDAGPAGGHDGDPRRLGDPIDADSSMEEAGDVQAEPHRIGDPLDAGIPDYRANY